MKFFKKIKQKFLNLFKNTQDSLPSIPEKYFKRSIGLKIEISNICNAKCVFCAYKNIKREKVLMDENTFDKVVSDYVAIGGGDVTISPVVGESLLNKKIITFVQKLKQTPEINSIGIYTNLLVLPSYSEEQIETLLDSIDWISISTGANKEDYLACFGIDGFDKFLEGIDCLIRYERKKGSLPYLLFNGRSLKKEPDIDTRLQERLNTISEPNLSWIHEYSDWGGEISDFSQEQKIVRVNRANQVTPVCKLGLLYSVVFSNGDVGICSCADAHAKLKIGNINENSLGEILSNDLRKEFLTNFHKGKIHPFCTKCTFYDPLKVEEAETWIDWVYPGFIGNIYNIIGDKPVKVERFQKTTTMESIID